MKSGNIFTKYEIIKLALTYQYVHHNNIIS